MNLQDLFVSHKQVTPARFDPPSYLTDDVFLNLDRARSAIIEQPETVEATVPIQENTSNNDSMNTWKVGNYNAETVSSLSPSPSPSPSSSSAPISSSSSSPKTTTHTSKGKLSGTMLDKSKYWMNEFAKYGLTTKEQIALVTAMAGECGLQPKGAVEKKELAGKGNTKAGWAHAGEGAVGFTFWNTKKRVIEAYNNHPNRKGPKLSTVESEYSKPTSRHIADLDNEDHALMAYIYYQDLLGKTKNLSFDDTIAEFYMQKAGRGFGNRKGAGNTPYEKALYTGKVYQQSHAKLGYHKAAKVNSFLRSLDFASNLAKQVGFTY